VSYRSQRIAYPYFAVAALLFGAQVVVGLYLVSNYFLTIPQAIVNVFPFATVRAMHTNLLVLWMLLGFMGGAYYITPEEAKREIFSPAIAYAQLVLLVGTGVAALIGFAVGWTEGKPLLEIPRALDFVVVVAALLFLFNIGMTVIRGKNWTVIQGTLLGGLVFLALLYLADGRILGLPYDRHLTLDWYYWWWVIHLWVEGAWELVTGAILAFVLLKLTGVPRETVEKWLYVEIGLFMFTGIAGTGHHYYWLGAPKYWFWIGGIFSALEPVPIIFMVVDTLRVVKERKLEIVNPLVWTYAVACAIFHLVGAGVWGFVHTLPQINRYTHGSQVTASHGHMAFFGAYALLNLTVFYFTVPRIRGVTRFREGLGRTAFWIMSLAMIGIGLAFGVAGVLQSYLERALGLGYMPAQAEMRPWFASVFGFGVVFLIGVLLFIYDFFTLSKRALPVLTANS